MRIDFRAPLLSITGEEMKTKLGPGGETVILGDVAKQALFTAAPGEQIPGPQKYRYYQLIRRIQKALDSGSAIDLPVEDVSLIKDRIGKVFEVGVVGPAFELLDRGVPETTEDRVAL